MSITLFVHSSLWGSMPSSKPYVACPKNPRQLQFTSASTSRRSRVPRNQTVTMCIESSSTTPSQPTSNAPSQPEASGDVCTYCKNVGEVDCPVCEGRGYFGRTITCYYCRGAKRIECPLCVDDVYKFSYVRTSPSEDSQPDSSLKQDQSMSDSEGEQPSPPV